MTVHFGILESHMQKQSRFGFSWTFSWPGNIAIISMIARPFPGVRATGAAVCMRKGPRKVPESFQQLFPVSQPWKHQPFQFCKCEFQRLIINASRAKSPQCQKIAPATTSPSFLGTMPFLGGGNPRNYISWVKKIS